MRHLRACIHGGTHLDPEAASASSLNAWASGSGAIGRCEKAARTSDLPDRKAAPKRPAALHQHERHQGSLKHSGIVPATYRLTVFDPTEEAILATFTPLGR